MAKKSENIQLPLYQQLVSDIEGQINSGVLKPGQRIPSEYELCEMYDVSRTTVRQALNELAMRGKVIRVKGRGTFIPKFIARKPFDGLTGFSREIKYLLNKEIENKVLKKEVILPSEEISQYMGLRPGEAVVELQRARYIKGIGVVGVDTRYLPFSRFEGLLEEDLENQSLYEILTNKYNTNPSRSYTEIRGASCPKDLADVLEIKPGIPVSYFKDVTFDQNEVPFEFGENYYRIDRYVYRVEIYQNNHPVKKPNG